ncbi:MAG: hypothetical protein NZ528_02615 [Caldilineales bacterium]|nr:hypothetical protein [Caldilineales bacterium]
MGWFNTILNAATAASAAYSAAQLRAMRQEQAEAAAIQAILTQLRDLAFQLRQMAESALSLEAQSPKVAAGALGVVEMQLQESGIIPDLFPTLADKEYTAQTYRLVANNKRRLYSLLTPNERAEVQEFLGVAKRLFDCNYYLEHLDDGRRLVKASDTIAKNPNAGCLASSAGLSLSMGGMALLGSICALTGVGYIPDLSPIAGGLALGGAFLLFFGLNAKRYRDAKKLIDELGDEIDVERFRALDQELGDAERARQFQAQAQAFVNAFLEERPLPPPPMLPPAAPPVATAHGNVGARGTYAAAGNGANRMPEPNRALPPSPAAARPPQIHVQRRTEAVKANARVVQGPPDSNGEPKWIVRRKEQEGDAKAPLGQFRCPECGRLYYVPLQPARLELFCLACGQGITVQVV